MYLHDYVLMNTTRLPFWVFCPKMFAMYGSNLGDKNPPVLIDNPSKLGFKPRGQKVLKKARLLYIYDEWITRCLLRPSLVGPQIEPKLGPFLRLTSLIRYDLISFLVMKSRDSSEGIYLVDNPTSSGCVSYLGHVCLPAISILGEVHKGMVGPQSKCHLWSMLAGIDLAPATYGRNAVWPGPKASGGPFRRPFRRTSSWKVSKPMLIALLLPRVWIIG